MNLNRHLYMRFLSGCLVLLSGCQNLWVQSEVKWLDAESWLFTDSDDIHVVEAEPDHPNAEPNPDEPTPVFGGPVEVTQAPRKLKETAQAVPRDLSLQEAIHLALKNNDFVRTRNEFLNPGNSIYTGGSYSRYEPGLQASEVSGNRGVLAALAEFDTQFTTNMLWGRDETVQNTPFLGGLPGGQTLVNETANFDTRLQKSFMTGDQFSVNHSWDYSQNNVPSRLFPSAYTGDLTFEYRRPLLAGNGQDYTSIAGPIGPVGSSAANAIRQGVEIARINEEISLTDFKLTVSRMLKEVEDSYWDYYLAYRRLGAEKRAYEEARKNWERLEVLQGQPGGGRGVLALGKENFYDSKQRVEAALADLYSTEVELRRLIGLEVGDGTILRPLNEPTSAEYLPDWQLAVAEALTKRPELERQKQRLDQIGFQLKAAKSLTQPRLDFVSSYAINGFGDRLVDGGTGATGFRSAYATLGRRDQTGWTLGFEFNTPLGNRTAYSQLNNLEMRFVRERKLLQNQEQEIRYELTRSFQNLDRYYQSMQTSKRQQEAAEERIEAADAEEPIRPVSLEGVDLQLRALLSARDAELQYYQSLILYNQTITDLHYRKGTILDYYEVVMNEGSDAQVDQKVLETWSTLQTTADESTPDSQPTLLNELKKVPELNSPTPVDSPPLNNKGTEPKPQEKEEEKGEQKLPPKPEPMPILQLPRIPGSAPLRLPERSSDRRTDRNPEGSPKRSIENFPQFHLPQVPEPAADQLPELQLPEKSASTKISPEREELEFSPPLILQPVSDARHLSRNNVGPKVKPTPEPSEEQFLVPISRK